MKQKNTFHGIWIITLIAVFFIGLSVNQSEKIELYETNQARAGLQNIHSISYVACSSDSMGLTLRCRDKLLLELVKKNDILVDGKIYIFKSPYAEGTTVHRLIANNETHALFKGDNNAIADPWVAREDIYYKVVGVTYS